MAEVFENPYRGQGLPDFGPLPCSDVTPVAELLSQCPVHAGTPLVEAPRLAKRAHVAELFLKDERGRMGLGSFKALGAAYAIARYAADAGGEWAHALAGTTFVTASAGNHGLSVSAGAALFGAGARIFLSDTVPEAFAKRLRDKGAEVVRAGATYEESMLAAEEDARNGGQVLLSDSSWLGYTEMPRRVMEGYLQLAAEAVEQIGAPPSHIVVQAGVGGMAAAVAAHARHAWGDGPTIIVVEPDAAPALFESIRAGRIVTTEGPVSSMGRLDCKTPSMIALAGLARDADMFVTISEGEAATAVKALSEEGLVTTPSGAAGVATVLAGLPCLGADARVLGVLSEGGEDG